MIDNIKKKALEDKVPIIKDGGLEFLLKTVKERNCKDILELGTAVGYSSMQMASISKDIHIDTIEKNEDMYSQAVENIKNNGFNDQIDVHFTPIEDFSTEKMYDLIFVDAAKAQYGKYMEQFLPNLKQDGIMLFDNMIFHGLIYDVDSIEPRSKRALVRKIVKFREFVQQDPRFDIMLYDDIGDGILVLCRRKA